jgi:hypothetical protein
LGLGWSSRRRKMRPHCCCGNGISRHGDDAVIFSRDDLPMIAGEPNVVENKFCVWPDGHASGSAGQCRVGRSCTRPCGASREGARRPYQERALAAPLSSRCADGGGQKSRLGRPWRFAGPLVRIHPFPSVLKFEVGSAGDGHADLADMNAECKASHSAFRGLSGGARPRRQIHSRSRARSGSGVWAPPCLARALVGAAAP